MTRSIWQKVALLTIVTVIVLGSLEWRAQTVASNEKAAAATAQKSKKQKPKKPLLAKFMRAKLTASSQVLEGLCTEDFELIAKGAKSLKEISAAEQWRVSNDAMYRQHSAEYRAGVDKLIKAAEEKKIDAAALAWTKTTLNCIECHRWVKAMLISDKQR